MRDRKRLNSIQRQIAIAYLTTNTPLDNICMEYNTTKGCLRYYAKRYQEEERHRTEQRLVDNPEINFPDYQYSSNPNRRRLLFV